MSIVDDAGKVLLTSPIGIGRGSLSAKSNMQDCITPAGNFVVDVILSDDPAWNQIDSTRQNVYLKNARFSPYVHDEKGLARVFATMNAQDFNHDGKPDHAYGVAFIGLDGKQDRKVTGPKLVEAGSSVRWYSIALHGTPNEKRAIGNATSEGCIHVPADKLKLILSKRLVSVGTPVSIKDDDSIRIDVKRKSSANDNERPVRMRN